MPRERKLALYIDGAWCSPIVGRFTPNLHHDGVSFLGSISRLARVYDIVLPEMNHSLTLLCTQPQFVEFGSRLAVASQPDQAWHVNKSDRYDILAPCAGFLRTTHADGLPICSHGQRVHPGDIVAVIEVMKLGVDVIYNGSEDACFIEYATKHAVAQNDLVAQLRLI